MINNKRLLGTFMLIVAIASAWILYDWKLSVIILLALYGNNLEQGRKNN